MPDTFFSLLVGIQVTWERLQQLGDIPCVRDGHTLRYSKGSFVQTDKFMK